MDFVIGLLGAGIGAGLMTILLACLNRKWAKDDREEAEVKQIDKIEKHLQDIDNKITELSDSLSHLKSAEKASLSDRIKWLGTKYLDAGEIEFEDRRILNQLHSAYHDDCGGNGDFDSFMEIINDLPLKTK